MLIELTDQNMEIIGNIYKTKGTKGHTLTKDSQVENKTLVVQETQNIPHVASFNIP